LGLLLYSFLNLAFLILFQAFKVWHLNFGVGWPGLVGLGNPWRKGKGFLGEFRGSTFLG